MKKIVKIAVDILMYVDFLFLMNEGVSRNLTMHAVFGIVLFALFIVHHILNGWFYKSLTKGKWNTRRIVLNVTAWLLFVLMILMAVSSVMMSGLVFEWSPVRTTQAARVLHLMSSSWGFMIMSVHLSLHMELTLKKLETKCNKINKIFFHIFLVIIAAAGVFAFYKTQLYIYMFNTGGWKMAAPNLITGFLEYIGITAGICAMEKIITFIVSCSSNQRNKF